MFDLELMKKLRAEGKTTKEAAQILGVSITTLKRKGWNKLPLNKLSIHTYKKDLDYFKSIDTSGKAYVLGFLLTDGMIDKKGTVRFEVSQKDLNVLKYIKSEISPTSPIKLVEREQVKGSYNWLSKTGLVYFKSKEYLTDLAELGIFPNKTYTKQILPSIPKKYMPHLIRGIFDGDGSVWKDGKYPRVSFTGEYNLLIELSSFLYKKDIISKLCTVFQKKEQHDCYFTFGARQDTKAFFDYIYKDAPFYLTRKFNKFNYELV